MNRIVTIAAALLAFAPLAAHAQTTAPVYQGQDGQTKEAIGTFPVSGGATGGTNAGQVQGNVADGAADVGNSVKVGGEYLATPPTLANGTRGAMMLDTRGNQYVALRAANGVAALGSVTIGGVPYLGSATVLDSTAGTGTPPSASTAVETGRVVKASAGNLFGLNVVTGATAGYVLIFNTTTIPADGAVTPVKCYAIATNTSLDLNLRAAPLYLSSGITVVFSTTGCFTKTASATAFISGDAK